MHNILIVEDDLTQLEALKKTIHDKYPLWKIYIADSFATAQNLIHDSVVNNNYFSLFLFDVQLAPEKDNRDGFLLAKNTRSHNAYYKTPILFLTAISDEAVYALTHFHCYNYISKPYTPQDIEFQLEQMSITGYINHAIEITDTSRIKHKIFFDDIVYAESKAHTVIIHCIHSSYITREFKLDEFNDLLDSNFIRCHKQYIINTNHINYYDRTSRYLHTQLTNLPVGRTYVHFFDNI